MWLKEKAPDDDFKEIFAQGKVAFGNLYPKGAKPIPLSALSCKYYSGFKGDEDNKHGVEDILIPLVKEGQIPDELDRCRYLKDGKPCQAPLKKFRGYYLKDISSNSLESIRVKKRLIYHTAISPISETALDGALYSQEVIEAGQTFRGDIWVYDDALPTSVANFIKNLKIFYVGSDKSTGFGRFGMLSDPVECDVTDKGKLRGRISGFNERLGLNDGKTYFSVTLQSDAIITDEFMRYKTLIEPEDLGIPEAELIQGVADNRLLQGWNAMTRLPKEDMIAIEKGSVFVFTVNSLNDSILERLHTAESRGIGKRRGEGFGRLTVCDSFHLKEGSR
ncbi:hypothetical protein M1N93_00595 [Dehalococcoidia bacterium]|nr:hypothetical protein [Dehalococcoidia bacterium]